MTNRFPRHRRWTTIHGACLVLSMLACGSIAGAQQPPAPDANAPERAAQLPEGSYLTPEPGRLQRTVSWIGTKLDGPATTRDGFYPELGGMITGAGVSVGPGFRHHVFGDRAVIDVSAAMSWRQYRAMNAQFTWPRLLNDRLTVGAQARYQDFTRINYFGIGNDSLENDRTNYRLKNIDALGFATVRANRWLSFTGRAGGLRRLDIEPGTSSLYPSIDDRFDEITAPSLVRQPNYLHADVAVDADTRDMPGYPSRGGRYRVSMAAFHDQSFGRYSFRRIEADAAQYLPLGRSVVALHARLALSQDDGQDVPFYLLPSLGGPNSLRGFADYRFRDRDLLMVNAEYRWPILHVADVAAFYDAGSVAATTPALTQRMHTDYGVGLRVHSARQTVARLDIARSTEGTRVLLTFTAPLGVPHQSVAPYVP
jgi:outer membrane protein assembly factor BamA